MTNTTKFYIHDEVYVNIDGTIKVYEKNFEHLTSCGSYEEAIQRAKSKLGGGNVGAFAQFCKGEIEKLPYQMSWKDLTKEMIESGYFIITAKTNYTKAWMRVSRKVYLNVVNYQEAKQYQDWKHGDPIWFPNRQMAINSLFDKTNNKELGGVKLFKL